MDAVGWGTVAAFGALVVSIVGGIGWVQARSLKRIEDSMIGYAKISAESITLNAKISADAIALLATTIKESSDRLDKVLQDEIMELREGAGRRLTVLEELVHSQIRELGYTAGYRDATKK